jgi:hypothetical protein
MRFDLKKKKIPDKKPTVLITRTYCSLFKITVHRLHHQTGRRYPQHPSQPTSIQVYSSKGSASASVVLNTDHSQRSQPSIASQRRVTAFNNPQRRSHRSSLSSVLDLLTVSASNRTPAAAQATTPPQ